MAYGYYLMGVWMPKGQSFLDGTQSCQPQIQKGLAITVDLGDHGKVTG